jgi:hypothetical protein
MDRVVATREIGSTHERDDNERGEDVGKRGMVR